MSYMRASHRASVLLTLALAAGACTGAGATSSQSVTPTGTAPSPTGTSAAPTAATAAPTASHAATPAPTPTATPSVAVSACPFKPIGYPGGAVAMKAPSDRLVNVMARSGSTEDTLTFVFELKGPASPGGASPTLRVRESKPPFSYGGSGKSFDVKGDRYIEVVFDGMTIADTNGTEVFKGAPLELGKFTGLRDAVRYDNFEGVVGWIVGMSDPACATVGAGAANEIVLTVAHD